jgi:aspartyl-tRNA(Asn)/glutamyl-tRNA(Gln) amidotransferase subunit A
MATIAEVVASIERGERSPVELVEEALAVVEAAQSRTNAVTSMLAETARARAKALEGEPVRGPLHGVPVAVKDMFDVAGDPTTGCCAAYGARDAARHADAVEALVSAGAVVVAKTNQHELMAGATSAISSFGPVRNPWDPGRLAGGSSGGSAALVAVGAVPLALGSDTGGSIRIPASFCGVTGLKPTHGTISLRGALPMGPGLDSAGPLAASAEDCALAMQVLRRPGRRPLAGDVPPDRLRVGLPRVFFGLLHPDTRAAVEEAAKILAALGAEVEEVDGPELDLGWNGFKHVWADVAHEYRDLWDRDGVHPEVAARIDYGRSMTGLDYAASLQRAREISDSFDRAMADVDLLLTPATPYPAPRITATSVEVTGGVLGVHDGSPSRLTVPVNLAGLPALAFPVGSSGGLPLGAQLIGPRGWDDVLLDLGMRYQRVTDWHTQSALQAPTHGSGTPRRQ